MSNEIQPLEVISGGALEAITRSEIDIQIATAHRYPRSISLFQKRALEMVGLDEETAASCIYRRPVGKENGKPVYAEGESVRLAEITAACYGNFRSGARIVEQTPEYVKAVGFAHDLETNNASQTEVIESTLKRDGKPYDPRMRIVIAKACIAKARRDATFIVIPKALIKSVTAEARKIAVGDATTLEKRREGVMAWISKLGVPKNRVFLAIGVGGESDIGLSELETLTGIKTALKDGDITLDEAFPEVREEIKMPVAKSKSAAAKAEPTAGNQPAAKTEEQPAAAKTPPVHQPADQYDELRIALSDLDIKQPWFVEGLRLITPDAVPKQAKVVADLPPETVATVLDEGLDTLISLIKSKKGEK